MIGWMFFRYCRLALGLSFAAVPIAGLALELHTEKESPYDLALKGKIEGLVPGELRYLRWSDLKGLSTSKMRVDGEFVPGEQEVTIVMLDEVLSKIPRPAGADAIISTCNDGYASIYTSEFIAERRPFIVLEINGNGPEKWPPGGMKFNPGPYVISIADQLSPGASKILDAGHKRPWGVDTLEFINYTERFSQLHTGALSAPGILAEKGRELWINSCFSCHNLPQENLGGTKATRPIQIVATHAAYNPDYFKSYVRNPTKMNPMAKMEPHPHYSDDQLNELIAFLKLTLPQGS